MRIFCIGRQLAAPEMRRRRHYSSNYTHFSDVAMPVVVVLLISTQVKFYSVTGNSILLFLFLLLVFTRHSMIPLVS